MATEGTTLLKQPPIITIETERLRLTTLQMSDLEDLEGIYTSPEVMKWTTTGPLTTRQQAETWLSSRALGSGVFQFSVRLRPSPSSSPSSSGPRPCIGILGSFHLPKIGYLFHPEHHGRGYATEAIRAFVPAYFAHVPSARVPSGPGPGPDIVLAYDYMEAWTDVSNGASHAVLRKNGFRRGAIFQREYEAPMLGGWRDAVVWHLPRPGLTMGEIGVGEDGMMIADDIEEGRLVPPVE